MARFSSQYKQQAPTRRIVSGENTYEKGMYWSNQALTPGYVHTLLNMEIDQLSMNLNIPGGLHVTDIASGSTFLDNLVFGDSSQGQVIVVQARNEYNLRAFEGITNIISVQKLQVKNNQTLEERLRQQGFTADDVICYKILTYNPINHRLMSVTLIQAARDRHFSIDQKMALRRLNSNPISCGLSEVWEGGYVSNRLDYHPNGASDNFVPRVRRNSLDETFGQRLHNSAHMQTVAHCEGFGNKTFCFVRKKQIELDGPIKNTVEVQTITVLKLRPITFNFGDATGYTVDTIIEIKPKLYSESQVITPLRLRILSVNAQGQPLEISPIGDGWGVYTWVWGEGSVQPTVEFEVVNYSGTGSGLTVPGYYGYVDRIVDASYSTTSTAQDIYLKNNNLGRTLTASATIGGVLQPLDAYRFGIALTSIGLLYNGDTLPTTVSPIDANNLWDNAVANTVQVNGAFISNVPAIELNLNTGEIRPTAEATGAAGALSFKILPVLDRGSNPLNTLEVTDLFSSAIVAATWGANSDWILPVDFLKDEIKTALRIGQSVRIAAYCKTYPTVTRYLNTLREDPLTSKYYTQTVNAVFALEYIWDGNSWQFSFVDTSEAPNINNPTLVENWELTGRDSLGNIIVRNYIWTNRLAYTDLVTEENVANMAPHIVDNYTAVPVAYNMETEEVLAHPVRYLTQNPSETLQEYIPGIQNKSKTFDVSYGHFDVTPKTLSPAMASNWGYNMLSNTPYVFECIDRPLAPPTITGVLLMSNEDNTRPLLKPIVNTAGKLYIYYDVGSDKIAESPHYQLKVEYKNIYDEWRPLQNFDAATTHNLMENHTPIIIPFTGVDETTLVRATIYDLEEKVTVANQEATQTEDVFLVVSQVITTLSYTKDPKQVNMVPNAFDLGSALGMTYWKGRLACWGILGAENLLFLSEPNEPEYFAYPNGVDVFEENIVHVIPYSDALIVFTSTKLWRVEMLTDGLSWTKTLLQQNLRITDKDIPYIIVLKNMLFFKSDKQFYMLVPQRGSTVGDLTIAPISKAMEDFFRDPWVALKGIVKTIYPELANHENEKPINEYLVKYGVHTEQNRVFVDWWFDLSDWQNQILTIGERQIQHDVLKANDTDDNPGLLPKEYWLVQLVYDSQTYSWSIRTHTSNHIGIFIADAINPDTDFLTLVFNPEYTLEDGTKPFVVGNENYTKATWGISIGHRRRTEDSLLQQFTLEPSQIITLDSTYPRFQVFDTGYKEVSTPALKKRFREIQLMFNPKPATEGDTVGLRAVYLAQIDGQTVMSSVSQEVEEELQTDGTLLIKVVDKINWHDEDLLDPDRPPNYVPLPYTVDSELSNTFVLDSSALAGVQQVRVRRAIQGKGQLVRQRFVNITPANYSIVGHAFVFHNKNARP